MRLGGRLAAAIEILENIKNHNRPIKNTLKDWGISHRFAGSSDRAVISNIVYDSLRKRLSSCYLMNDDSSQALVYGIIFREWGINPQELIHKLSSDHFAPPLPTQSMLSAFNSHQLKNAPDHIQADIPEWIKSSIQLNFGSSWLKEATELAQRPPLDLRTNILKITREKLHKTLEHFKIGYSTISQFGLRIPATQKESYLPKITTEISFHKGWFEIQDEGSQIASQLTAFTKGRQVLDFCAGGGGKTLALSMFMKNKGQIHAWDSDKSRIAPIIERIKRAGIHNVQVHSRLSTLLPLQEHFDTVLIDAPCSGSGTWRRHPDMKWRLSEQSLEKRILQQETIINQASKFVKINGHLIYVTCSILPQENIIQIQKFLNTHPQFRIVPAIKDWHSLFDIKALQPHFFKDGGLNMTPASTNTDGFFFCKLKRHY
ncbi:Sun protein [Liberibacter crescens BT-1]|uniref:Sun protein n=1 Tax=Liberibacter crescens (strain BT-1) TaxID=1215343 RepID=L0EXU0_LIBCB|nr:RsmB/NOP family class I SAM-dependent RNA methyltransferase [Liberibacter crescens]AGA65191.1 Sun protein [Liberibacter crescens BT-1]AMC13147.1 MFS transporter [Liberibacter crescens]